MSELNGKIAMAGTKVDGLCGQKTELSHLNGNSSYSLSRHLQCHVVATLEVAVVAQRESLIKHSNRIHS